MAEPDFPLSAGFHRRRGGAWQIRSRFAWEMSSTPLATPTPVGGYSPVLTDAALMRTGRTSSVKPLERTAETMLDGRDDSMLVTLQGRLLMALEGPGRKSLVLQAGTRTFTAQLDTSDTGAGSWQLAEGSVLRLTGVCSMQVDPARLYRILEEDPPASSSCCAPPGI